MIPPPVSFFHKPHLRFFLWAIFLLTIVQYTCQAQKTFLGYNAQEKKDIWEKIEAASGLDNEQCLAQLDLLQKKHYAQPEQADSNFAKLLHYRARIHWRNKNFAKAQSIFEESILCNNKVGSMFKKANTANAYFNLGGIALDQNKRLKALSYFEQSLTIAKKYSEKKELTIRNYKALANINSILGDYTLASKQIEKGIQLCGSNNNDYKFDFLINKIDLLVRQKDLNKALTLFDELNDFKDQEKLMVINNIFANIYYNNSKYTLAKQFISKNLNQKYTIDSGQEMFQSWNLLGQIYHKENNFSQAKWCFYNALKSATNTLEQAKAYSSLAYCYYARKQYPEAIVVYHQGLARIIPSIQKQTIFDTIKETQLKSTAEKDYVLELLGEQSLAWLAYYKQTKSKKILNKALANFKACDQLLDLMRQSMVETKSNFYWRKKSHKIYEAAIETSFLAKNAAKCHYFMEKSKAMILLDALQGKQAIQLLSSNYLEKEQDFQHKITELNLKLEQMLPPSQKDSLLGLLLETEVQKKQFNQELEAQNPNYYQLKYPKTGSLESLRAYLKQQQEAGYLSIFEGEEYVYVFCFTAHKNMLYRLATGSFMAKKFLGACSKGYYTKTELQAFNKISIACYKQLFAALKYAPKNLYIAQDQHFIPFEALKKTSANYLVMDHNCSYVYSASQVLNRRQKSFFWPWNKFLGLAPEQFSQKLNTLSGSDKALKDIAKKYFFPSLLCGKNATKKNFFAKVGQYHTLQLYTHATADSSETEPRLYFADNSARMNEFSAIKKLNTQLIILSACNTGVGKHALGEGTLSLGRSFITLGIPRVISSLWYLNDAATYKLSASFHTSFTQNNNSALSLQLAKIAYLKQASKTETAPNYWAGLVHLGP
jgi:hypothetical protein